MKKLLTLSLVGVIAIGSMSLSFAASPFKAADIYAGLAEITVEQAYAIKFESGETFGDLAKEAGFYEAFAEAVLASKINMINDLVAEGKLTQAEAARPEVKAHNWASTIVLKTQKLSVKCIEVDQNSKSIKAVIRFS